MEGGGGTDPLLGIFPDSLSSLLEITEKTMKTFANKGSGAIFTEHAVDGLINRYMDR